MAASGKPRLQQRRVGGHRHERQPDRSREHAELPEIGLALRRLAPARRQADRQADDGEQAHAEMDDAREMRRRLVDQQVSVDVAGEQRALEEEHRHRPHRRRAAEHRQHHLGEHRLDGEQQERGEEGGGREHPHHRRSVLGEVDEKLGHTGGHAACRRLHRTPALHRILRHPLALPFGDLRARSTGRRYTVCSDWRRLPRLGTWL